MSLAVLQEFRESYGSQGEKKLSFLCVLCVSALEMV